MEADGIIPSYETFVFFIRAATDEGNPQRIQHYFKEMRSLQLEPQTDVYNLLIQAHGSDMNGALNTFEVMKKNKIPIFTETLNALLQVTAAAKRVDIAKLIWNSFQKKFQLSPDLETFRQLIRVNGRTGNLVDAIEFTRVMLHVYRVIPDYGVWKMVLYYCAKYEVMSEDVWRWRRRIREWADGVIPDREALQQLEDFVLEVKQFIVRSREGLTLLLNSPQLLLGDGRDSLFRGNPLKK